ncbi:MAG TPA: leucyl aminopeptidase [Thermoanaerobaculia bacterium]|jgi:leucyl aminopeptidase|nr:leucyl aminopeptidase [Thermoanaerobaculia bacterium]
MDRIVDVSLAPAERPHGGLLLVGCCEEEPPDTAALPPWAAELVRSLGERPGWKGREGQWAEADSGREELPHVALRGLGKREALHVRKLARWLQETAAVASLHGVARLVLALPAHELTSGPAAAGRVTRQLALSRYRYDEFKQKADEEEPLVAVQLLRPVPSEGAAAEARAIADALEVARGARLTRDLANAPPNQATPEWMAEAAQRLADEVGLTSEVLVTEDLELLGMGGILAVGAGSKNPPRLVRLTWQGAASPRVALVGKGVTFDTGGISIKPAKDMDEMKWDKSGACTVLGLVQAVARLKLPLHLQAYLPLAENMPGGGSYRPGDIVRTHSGKTVEVLNTDAEGRIILADALSWAAEQKPDYIVEYSTLTGACVVALGNTGAGLYTPSDELAAALLRSAESAGERLWRMPLWPEFKESLKGSHGDLRNVAGRWGGANTAAAFLSHFVGDVQRWAHLDIAGPAYIGGDDGERGATGYGVALTVDWLRSLTA